MKLFNLYEIASGYLNGADKYTSKEIIEIACDVLADSEFNELYAECVAHINMWTENTLEKHIAQGDEIIEEISGVLGEHFKD